MKRLTLCLLLTGCVTPPETMTVTDPKGKPLAVVNFKTNTIQLTENAMQLLMPRRRRR